MTLQTRELTGLDPWPLSLVTGPQKSGKTHQAVAASASPLIDRTFWFTYGEPTPDGFKNIDTGIGAPRVEPVLYDGTYRGLLGGVQDAVNEPRRDPRKPNLIVLDSGTKVWELIKDMAQAQANNRWARRKDNENKKIPEEGVVISSDLWNTARDRWDGIVNLLLQHDGPAIITARLDNVNVVNAKGDPTGEKIWKVQAHKSLPSEVDAIVEVNGRGKTNITGVRSSRFHGDPNDSTRFPDFSFDAFWRKLGFADNAIGVRDYVTSTGVESQARDDYVIAKRAELLAEIAALAVEYRVHLAFFGQKWVEMYKHPIDQTADIGALELFRDDARSRLKARAEANNRTGNAA